MKNIHILPTDKPSRLFYLASNLHLEQGQLISPKNYQNIYITNDDEIKEGNAYITKHGEVCKSHNGSKIILFKTDKKIILTTDQDLIKDGVQAIDDEFLEWFIKNPSCEYVDLIGLRKEEGYEFLGYEIIIPKEEPCTCTDECIGYLTKTCKRIEEEPKLKCICDSENDKWVCTRDCTNKELKQETELDAYYRNGVGGAKQETLEEAAERLFKIYSSNTSLAEGHYDYMMDKEDFKEASLELSKWQQERMYSEEEVWKLVNKLNETLNIGSDLTLEQWFEKFKKK